MTHGSFNPTTTPANAVSVSSAVKSVKSLKAKGKGLGGRAFTV